MFDINHDIPPLNIPFRREKLPFCEHYTGNEKFFHKALAIYQNENNQNIDSNSSFKFDITLDLEDGAVCGQEQFLRSCFNHLLGEYHQKEYSPRIGLRIHEIDMQEQIWQQDLLHTLGQNSIPSYIMIPKVNNIQELKQVQEYLNHISIEKKCDKLAHIPLHVLIETPQALQNIHEIVAFKNVQSLSFGIMDYVSHLDGVIPPTAMYSPEQFTNHLILQAKMMIVQACAWVGKVANHNVCVHLEHQKIAEHAFSDAQNAKKLGFNRMWSIHPEQISAIIQAFTPMEHEKEKALEILSLAKQANWGPIMYQHQLHDRASYRYYYQLLMSH